VRPRHDGRIDHQTVDNLRRAIQIRCDDALRPRDLRSARRELFKDNRRLGRMNTELAAGAASQGLATRLFEGFTVIDRERRTVEGRRLSGRAAGDRQPTQDMLSQHVGRRGAKVEKEVGRPKGELANARVGDDLADAFNAARGFNLGENLNVRPEPAGHPLDKMGALDLRRANPLQSKLGQGAKICIMPRRPFAIASDKDRAGQTLRQP